MGIIVVMTLIAVAGTWNRTSAGGLPGLVIGGIVFVIFVVVYSILLPRLEFLPPQAVMRTRRRTVPFAAVAVIKFHRGRAGTWIDFIGDDSRSLARMSIGGSLFATPTSEQWAALRHLIHSAAVDGGVSFVEQPTSGKVVDPRWAIGIIDAQIAWRLAGHRSTGGRAPAASLVTTSIMLR